MKIEAIINKKKPFKMNTFSMEYRESINIETCQSAEVQITDDDGNVTKQEYGYTSQEEIKRAIDNHQDLNLSCCYIEGFDFRNCDVKSITAVGAIFNGVINLSGITLNGKANFTKAIFYGETDLSGMKFKHGAEFHGAKFIGEVMCTYSIFDFDADFSVSIFYNKVIFALSNFKYEAMFSGAKFKSGIICEETIFNAGVEFSSEFDNDAYFVNAKFNGCAEFSQGRIMDREEFLRNYFYNDKISVYFC